MGSKKGHLHKTYANEFKLEVLERMKTNQSHKSIAREFGVSLKTMENWQYKLNQGKDIFEDNRLKTIKNSKPTYEEQKQYTFDWLWFYMYKRISLPKKITKKKVFNYDKAIEKAKEFEKLKLKKIKF